MIIIGVHTDLIPAQPGEFHRIKATGSTVRWGLEDTTLIFLPGLTDEIAVATRLRTEHHQNVVLVLTSDENAGGDRVGMFPPALGEDRTILDGGVEFAIRPSDHGDLYLITIGE